MNVLEYVNIIFCNIKEKKLLRHLKHLNVSNVVALQKESRINININVGYGNEAFFNVNNKNYVNLQVHRFDEIMLIFNITREILLKFAIFMCIDKKYFNYAKDVISFFLKYKNINYKILEKSSKQTIFEYKQMLLNYVKLIHKTYVYYKRIRKINKEEMCELSININKYENLTRKTLIDYYFVYFIKNKQNIKLLSFLNKKKRKSFKKKLQKRLQKIKNIKIENKYVAFALDKDIVENLLFDEKTSKDEHLKILSACVFLHCRKK